MLNIVLFGPPGSGKGTQAEKIIKKYKLNHLSTGDLLRAEIASRTELGLKARSIMDKGELVPDEVVVGMIEKRIIAGKKTKGFIFDGFPRTVAQAKALDAVLDKRNMSISLMISLDVKRQELINRLLKRGKEQGRSDDNLQTIENRIKVYEDQTTPVMNYYDQQGKAKYVDGMGSIEEIFRRIEEVIANK
jgi:adenylate kinase